MTSALKYRSISPTVTSIYDSFRAASPFEPPSPTQLEHGFARRSISHHPPSPSMFHYQLSETRTAPNRPSYDLSTPNSTPRSRPTQLGRQAEQPPSHFHQQAHPVRQSTHPISSSSPPSSRRTNSYPGPRVTIPPRAILQHVPSPIGSPVSPLYQSYRFQPIIEDDDDEATSRGERVPVIVEDNSSAWSPVTTASTASTSHTKRKRPHPRLSILLTPPLSATGSRGATSPPPTPILAVLEEGYHQCLRAVLKQDALVAAVNHTRHLRIASSSLYCPESEPRSQGAYGDVWFGRLDEGFGNTRIVAVKRIRLKPQDGPSNASLLKALLQEAIPWYGLNHQNITPFIGYTFDNGYAALISEWQPHGHIFEYLAKYPRANRLEMIVQTAEGLAYLHDRSPSLIHGDIKPENVLVSKEGVVKLTDFGLSTILHSQSTTLLRTTHSFRGTVHYADPALLDDRPTTKFTDIWALAWLIFGILTLRRPYNGIQPESRVILKIMNYDVPSPNTYSDLPFGDLVWPVLQASWSRSTKDRWSAGFIARYIQQKMK